MEARRSLPVRNRLLKGGPLCRSDSQKSVVIPVRYPCELEIEDRHTKATLQYAFENSTWEKRFIRYPTKWNASQSRFRSD